MSLLGGSLPKEVYIEYEIKIISMSKSKTSEKEILELFDELKRETNNFKNIKSEFFIENPQKILIVRLIFNMGLKQFAKFSNISHQALGGWERNETKPTKWKISKVLSKITPHLIKEDKSIENIINNFRYFKTISNGYFNSETAKSFNKTLSWIERQSRSIYATKFNKRTSEEMEIAKLLKRAKICFSEQFPLIKPGISKAGCILVDFFIEYDNKKMIIEACKLNTNERTEESRSIRLAYESLRIKKYFPNMITICALKVRDRRLKHIEKLKEVYDSVFINKFSDIPEYIKKICAEGGNFQAF